MLYIVSGLSIHVDVTLIYNSHLNPAAGQVLHDSSGLAHCKHHWGCSRNMTKTWLPASLDPHPCCASMGWCRTSLSHRGPKDPLSRSRCQTPQETPRGPVLHDLVHQILGFRSHVGELHNSKQVALMPWLIGVFSEEISVQITEIKL